MTPLPAFDMAAPGRLIFGRGTAAEAAGLALAMGRRVLLVHGRAAQRAAWLHRALEAGGAAVTTVSCPAEPDLPRLEAALGQVRPAGPEVVVALGGGAVLDMGKALAALLPAPRAVSDHLEVVGRGLPLEAAPLPMLALPTTAGTGSEVTRNAVIGVPEARRKVSLRDPRMVPDVAIVDPALTDGLPREVTLASGLDALTQVIEPYLSTRAAPLSDALCAAAIPVALPALMRLMAAEDPQARDRMAWVSLCGGLALAQAGLGAVHGLAGVIGGMAPGAPHGAVCGALLPHVLEANAARMGDEHGAAERMARVLDWLSGALEAARPRDVPAALAAWARAQGLPGLAGMGLGAGDHPAVARAARHASSMKPNPVVLEEAALVACLRAAA